MKPTVSFLSLLCIVIAALIAGCSSATEPDPTSAPAPPGSIAITVHSDSTSATVTWTASADNDVTGYRVMWKGLTYKDSGSVDVVTGTLSAKITGLIGGQDYNISAYSMRDQALSSPVTAVLTLAPSAAPAAPSGLVVSPINQTTIAVKWDPSPTATGYRVVYRRESASKGDTLTVTTTSATLTNLQAEETYVINVQATKGGSVSAAASVMSATTMHYDTEPDGVTKIRMYEQKSSNSSGITLDPSKGGPKSASMVTGDQSLVQLAIYVDDTFNSLYIGPAYAFAEYKNVDKFDPNVYISDSTFLATVETMDDWYYGTSIEDKIMKADGNLRAFALYQTLSTNKGHGFFVRTGPAGNYHYARVFIKNEGGKLLQGTTPNRYVELEITYQTKANLPYAKRSSVLSAPAGVSAQRRR